MTIRATHAPLGAKGMPRGPDAVRYNTSLPWPPVRHRHDARCICTRAFAAGMMRIKYADAMCPGWPDDGEHDG